MTTEGNNPVTGEVNNVEVEVTEVPTEGTDGAVELTDRQRKALDSKLVKFLASADKKTADLVTEALTLIDECIAGDVWTVALDAAGNPYADGYTYVLSRIEAAPNFHKSIAHPIAERLLGLVDEKGKKVFSVRKVEEATGVSRGKLNEMNQTAKREARVNDGTSTEADEAKVDEAAVAKKVATQTVAALVKADDAVQDMVEADIDKVIAAAEHTIGVFKGMKALKAQAEEVTDAA